MNKPTEFHTLQDRWDAFIEIVLSKNIVLVQAIGICPVIAIGIKLKYGVILTICMGAIILTGSLFTSLVKDKLPSFMYAPIYTVGASAISWEPRILWIHIYPMKSMRRYIYSYP
jgi:Na+-transporting NADH:ubiquinone oxidoreductase subunit NqrD